MKKLNVWIVTCCWILTVLAARADDLKPEQLYKKVLPSVMTLTVQKDDGTTATGTGFLAVKEGLAVTAWHVVRDARTATAKFSDGEEFEVSGLVDKDEKRDVALVRVKEFGRPLLPLAAAAPEVGAKAYAVGAPEGLEFSLSDGLISQIQKPDGVTLYQFSCPASPGNSGGPLVNAGGEVIGVVSRQFRDGQNLNFAMPAAYALALDTSLPTQTWGSVKATAQPDTAGTGAVNAIGNAVTDKCLVDCAVTLSDTATALQVTDDLYRGDHGPGFMAGVPPSTYSLQRALASEADDLELMKPGDLARYVAVGLMLERVKAAQDTLGLFVQATHAAQEEGGWYGVPNDLLAQSAARSPEFMTPYPAGIKTVIGFASCRASLPASGVMGLPEDTTGFQLGACAWVHSPLDLAAVAKGSLADKMGLRADDTLVSADDTPLKSLLDLKVVLKANVGGKVKIAVMRGGKHKEWQANIPHGLLSSLRGQLGVSVENRGRSKDYEQ